jgi:hypothetical protein
LYVPNAPFFGVNTAPDDLEGDVGFVAGPFDETPRVTAIGEHPRDKRVAGARGFQGQLATVTILHVGAMDPDGEQPSLVSVRMCRLRPVIFLPASNPFAPLFIGGADRLAVQDRR